MTNRQPPPIVALNHVGIHVEDVARSESFYREVLGLVNIERPELDFPGAWLQLGTTQELHLIGKNSSPDSPPRERHFALEVEDATAWAEHLQHLRIEHEGPGRRPDGALQIFFRDPDGHVVELAELRP
ncbi:MAG: VOC family protein [Planctomycetota bacterium]|nr:VOC family protein [Planctomycetota bacterium]